MFKKFIIASIYLCFSLLSLNALAQSPVEYVENKGQWEGDFLFRGTTPKGDIYIKNNGFRILLADGANHDKVHGYKHGWNKEIPTLKYHAFDIIFENCNLNTKQTTEKAQKHYYNYFLGNNPKKWKSEIHPVLAVNNLEIYNNIDAHIYSDHNNIKYDFIIKAGGNYQDIQLKYDGIDKIKLEKGKLVITTSLGDINESIPYSYQIINGERKEISCKYVLKNNKVSFEVSKEYNKDFDLYIDPVLVFCSFTGSAADNWGYTATYDSLGNFYAGGIAGGIGYPTTIGVIQPSYAGGSTTVGNFYACDASFTKYNANGNSVIYATYFGGTSNDQPHSIIVDNNDQLCIAGRTYSSDLPVTPGCYDNTANGGADMFIAKFNSLGTVLVGSTYIGGSGDDGVNEEAQEFIGGVLKHNYADDARSEIIFDNSNNVYIASCTKSSNFPTTANAFQSSNAGLQDAVIMQLNNNLSSLMWSTYSGGSNNDAAYVLSINKTNPAEIFVGGGTMSLNYPSTAGSLNSVYQGGSVDGFLMKFNTTSKALLASTFIGTNQYDQVYGVQTDNLNNVFIMGQTLGAYPVTAGVYSNPNSSQFVTKLNNNISSILASTVYGTGSTSLTNISPNAFLIDKCQNIYVSGWGGNLGFTTNSSTLGLPTTPTALQSTTDGNDFYFIVFDQDMTGLLYASYFGQNGGVSEHVDGGTSRFDEKGVIYQAICAACGGSTIFPTTAGAAYTQNGSTNCNLAALKIDFQLINPSAEAVALGDSIGCAPFTVQFQNNSTSATDYVWNFGDGSSTTTTLSPSHTYTNPGTYVVSLIANNPNGCTASSDTDFFTIIVKADTIHASFTYVKVDSCNPFTANFTNTSINNLPNTSNTSYVWDFGDGTTYTGQNPPLHSFPTSTSYTVTLTMTDTNACNSPSVYTLKIDYNTSIVSAGFNIPDSICMPANVVFNDLSTNATNWTWAFGDGNGANISTPSHTYLTPGVYNVILLVGNPATCNKLDTAQQTISVFSSPIADFTWSPNPPTPNTPNVFTNYSTGATSYFWDFGDGTHSTNKNDVHVYDKDGYYNVCLTAMNDVGCKDTACKTVRGIVVPLVDVPTGFSPNGDGINDIVYVKGYGIESMTFRIFNRWGQKVFESTKKSDGWDGRFKGVMQEMEVYQYTLSATFMDGTSTFKKGNITLLK